MREVEAVAKYLPAVVVRRLCAGEDEDEDEAEARDLRVPWKQTMDTVCLFADVSGFTALTENMAASGPEGGEMLAHYLNSYVEQIVRHVSKGGCDVLKFAGDAIIAIWPASEDVATLARRAVQAALDVQLHLHEVTLAQGAYFRVKIGLGVGRVAIAHVGGLSDGVVDSRLEYVPTGAPLAQAFAAEHCAEPGDVIASPEVWATVQAHCEGDTVAGSEGHVRVTRVLPASLLRLRGDRLRLDELTEVRADALRRKLWRYVPASVAPFLRAEEESWGQEMRQVTVLFANFAFNAGEIAEEGDHQPRRLAALHRVYRAVQRAVFAHEGTINKFLVDDKGSTLVAGFGMPPLAHENDAARAALAALAACANLRRLSIPASIGVASGLVFCGVAGHRGGRREFTMLGDAVNLAARLMSHAVALGGGGVITDAATAYAASGPLVFRSLGEVTVKGKAAPVSVYAPIPKHAVLEDKALAAELKHINSDGSGGGDAPGAERRRGTSMDPAVPPRALSRSLGKDSGGSGSMRSLALSTRRLDALGPARQVAGGTASQWTVAESGDGSCGADSRTSNGDDSGLARVFAIQLAAQESGFNAGLTSPLRGLGDDAPALGPSPLRPKTRRRTIAGATRGGAQGGGHRRRRSQLAQTMGGQGTNTSPHPAAGSFGRPHGGSAWGAPRTAEGAESPPQLCCVSLPPPPRAYARRTSTLSNASVTIVLPSLDGPVQGPRGTAGGEYTVGRLFVDVIARARSRHLIPPAGAERGPDPLGDGPSVGAGLDPVLEDSESGGASEGAAAGGSGPRSPPRPSPDSTVYRSFLAEQRDLASDSEEEEEEEEDDDDEGEGKGDEPASTPVTPTEGGSGCATTSGGSGGPRHPGPYREAEAVDGAGTDATPLCGPASAVEGIDPDDCARYVLRLCRGWFLRDLSLPLRAVLASAPLPEGHVLLDLELVPAPAARAAMAVDDDVMGRAARLGAAPTTEAGERGEWTRAVRPCWAVQGAGVTPVQPLPEAPSSRSDGSGSSKKRGAVPKWVSPAEAEDRCLALRHALLVHGAGSVVVVEGDVGIGKSRLLDHALCEDELPCFTVCMAGDPLMVAGAAQAAAMRAGRADATDAVCAAAFAPWRTALRGVVEDQIACEVGDFDEEEEEEEGKEEGEREVPSYASRRLNAVILRLLVAEIGEARAAALGSLLNAPLGLSLRAPAGGGPSEAQIREVAAALNGVGSSATGDSAEGAVGVEVGGGDTSNTKAGATAPGTSPPGHSGPASPSHAARSCAPKGCARAHPVPSGSSVAATRAWWETMAQQSMARTPSVRASGARRLVAGASSRRLAAAPHANVPPPGRLSKAHSARASSDEGEVELGEWWLAAAYAPFDSTAVPGDEEEEEGQQVSRPRVMTLSKPMRPLREDVGEAVDSPHGVARTQSGAGRQGHATKRGSVHGPRPASGSDASDAGSTALLVMRMRAQAALIAAVVRALTASAPTVLVVDDALSLHGASRLVVEALAWSVDEGHRLCTRPARPVAAARVGRPLPLLLAIATRPPETHAESPSAVAAYEATCALQCCVHMGLAGLPQAELARVTCEALGVDALSPAVQAFVSEYSRGNPLFAVEMASQLLEDGVLCAGAEPGKGGATVCRVDIDRCSDQAIAAGVYSRHPVRGDAATPPGTPTPTPSPGGSVGGGGDQPRGPPRARRPSATAMASAMTSMLRTGQQRLRRATLHGRPRVHGGASAARAAVEARERRVLSMVVPKPPVTVWRVMETWLDGLGVVDQMTLKVGALLGHAFTCGQVQAVFPLPKHVDRVPASLERLCDAQLLRADAPMVAASSSTDGEHGSATPSSLVRYDFRFEFLREVLHHRMLQQQRSRVLRRIAEWREEQERAARRAFLDHSREANAPMSALPLRQATLDVKKHMSRHDASKFVRGGIWKRRFVVLRQPYLAFFTTEGEAASALAPTPPPEQAPEGAPVTWFAGTLPTKARGALLLRGARVSTAVKDPGEHARHPFRVIVEASAWSKGRHLHTVPRTFTLAAHDEQDMWAWVYWIKLGVESSRTQSGGDTGAADAGIGGGGGCGTDSSQPPVGAPGTSDAAPRGADDSGGSDAPAPPPVPAFSVPEELKEGMRQQRLKAQREAQ